MPEMISSFKKACAGARVEHLTSVVDFWRTVEPRHLPSHNMTAFYAFRMCMNQEGRVVLQTKEFMHHTCWSPDPSFAPAMLRDVPAVASTPAFQYVVPNVLDVAALSRAIDGNSVRLGLLRSVTRFPQEQPGEALSWWRSYLDGELGRVKVTCADCVRIRTRLSKIVISQLSKNATAAQKALKGAQTQERKSLEAELSGHDCVDRLSGRLSVTITPGSVLHRINISLTEPLKPRTQVTQVLFIITCQFVLMTSKHHIF